MTSMLGKRKHREQILKSGSNAEQGEEAPRHLQILLQQHFEAKFKPLEGVKQNVQKQEKAKPQLHEDELDSDWTGISEPGDEEPQQIIHHHMSQRPRSEFPKEELKKFMSTKPPSTANQSSPKVKLKRLEQVGSKEAATDAENLKKDLALQRLLKESHLLESKSSLSLSGQNRHKALDLRLQDLGSKSSIYTQPKMPLAQRKGIIAKAIGRDESRRREAKENGIILEKVVYGHKKQEARRQRGVGAPSVGKFQGGVLKLSRKDVAEIVGPERSSKGKGRK